MSEILLNDKIHGINEETPRYLRLSRFNLASKEECIKAWNEIVSIYEIREMEKVVSQKGLGNEYTEIR